MWNFNVNPLPPLPKPKQVEEEDSLEWVFTDSIECPGCEGKGKYKGTFVIGYEEDPCTWCDGWGCVPKDFKPPSRDGKDLFTKPYRK